VFERFDNSLRLLEIDFVTSSSLGEEHRAARKFKQLLDSLTEREKLVIVAQNTLEVFIHDFFSAIDDSSLFTIMASPPSHEPVDLKALVTSLHEAQLDWQAAHSARPSVWKRLAADA
jgi:hypothetical protein